MLFNSYEFIFFFLPITLIIYFSLAKTGGNRCSVIWMTAASVFFYGWWDYRYVPLLFASICFNYLIGARVRCGNQGKYWLVFGICADLVLLGYFKYMGFFLATVNELVNSNLFISPQIILPLGISFFTFTQIGYLVDAYRKQTENESFFTYCEFVTIFPHLIAGPIIHHRDMIPQFTAVKNYVFNYKNASIGLVFFLCGLFKKVVIADEISPWVGNIFACAESLTFLEAWIGAIGYTLQLYFDFSGYSEMAIGLGLMFNIQFPQNFNSPYQARNVIDFWRRWHMTLGLWVRDYLYIPLGGNRLGYSRTMLNLFISMLLIGAWHGAGWTFIFWGALHGFFLVINHSWRKMGGRLPTGIDWTITFLCVVVGWVFFRAGSFHEAMVILYAMTDIKNIVLPLSYVQHIAWLQEWGVSFAAMESQIPLRKAAGIIFVLLVIVMKAPNVHQWAWNLKPSKKLIAAIIIVFFYIVVNLNRQSEFLYFQF
ncbi:MBOAT family protein [Selenomonas sp. TAMA-11512]|uniref:MBOAT family O-acyltransferase n=1 Tax=Selenomonas sp. TAMA-11512 TaxID=3095337 RepID=UPI0030D447EB